MKVIVNGEATGETVKDTTELLTLALYYFLHSKEKLTITLEEEDE